MPHSFSALILPDTIPQEDAVRQLLVYFETVFIYSPMENIAPLPTALATLCQHYAPAPLGDGLATFEQLIRDMAGNRAEYYGGGLSRMSTGASSVNEESVWRLISRLHPQGARRPGEESLLQARLLLKLAEVRDREEKEIRAAMARIDGQAQAMLLGLSDDDDEEIDALQVLPRFDREPANDTLDRRLWAWAHLFLNDSRMAGHWLLATTPEVMAILVDQATKHYGETPVRLFGLPLPGRRAVAALTPQEYIGKLTAWRQEAADCLASLPTSLKASAASGRSESNESIQEELVACFDSTDLWSGAHQGSLEFYLLPLSLRALFAKIAHTPDPLPEGHPLPYGIVAALNPDSQ